MVHPSRELRHCPFYQGGSVVEFRIGRCSYAALCRKGLGPRETFLILLISGFLATSISAFAQANASSTENQAPFQLKITSNLVVVRVVVRDAQNKPVENLKKEDFKLFDRGKKQSIAQFAVDVPVSQRAASPAAVPSGQPSTAVAPTSAMPRQGVADRFQEPAGQLTRERSRSAWLWICLSVVVINARESVRVTFPLSQAAENGRS